MTHNSATFKMANKLDPLHVTEKLQQLAPEHVKNITKCTIGLHKEFLPPKFAGIIVMICFDNVVIPRGVIMSQMIKIVSMWCNIPKDAITRCNIVFVKSCLIKIMKSKFNNGCCIFLAIPQMDQLN